MKRFIVSLLTSILAFTAGLVTASSWSSRRATYQPITVNVSPPSAPHQPQPLRAPVQSYTVTPAREIEFGQNGLKLVPERVQLKSESRNYDIDVSYPQILGMPYSDPNKIRSVNEHLKDSATKLYQWPQNPPAQMSYTQLKSGARHTVNFTYQVGLATDSLLSISFIGYSYNGVLSQQLQDSFSVSYDLTTGKQLKLAELFKPRSKYLELISSYCTNEISRRTGLEVKAEALKPISENFNNWHITPSGVTFYFKTCQVIECKEGDLNVDIPFEKLNAVLNSDIPGKFNIT
jgi:hypothetical protein